MNHFFSRVLPFVILAALGTLLAMTLVPQELEQMQWELSGMPENYPIEQKMRPILLMVLCYLPAIGALVYGFMGTMDRYMSRNFISYFLMCTLILLLIYMLADFTDNMERFRERFDNPLPTTFVFYGTQLPMFLYQILPYTLLMGSLWCLSKLSGTCEITGMLQSGRSLLRLCMPVFFFSALVALAYGIFGFHWASNGSLYRQVMLKPQLRLDGSLMTCVHRNDATNRIWRIASPPTMENPGAPMRNLTITQFDSGVNGRRLHQYRAESAVWDKATSTWTLRNGALRRFAAPGERPQDDELFDSLTLDFIEKPYQIIAPTQSGRIDAMGTSALYEVIASGTGSREDRFKWRTEWHVRIARIFSCLVLVLLAIPSAVTFQRRGTMKGIGIAVLLAALMLFLYRVFPALGESGLMQAWISAWIPNVFYVFISIYLFRINLAHRTFREWLAAKMQGKP